MSEEGEEDDGLSGSVQSFAFALLTNTPAVPVAVLLVVAFVQWFRPSLVKPEWLAKLHVTVAFMVLSRTAIYEYSIRRKVDKESALALAFWATMFLSMIIIFLIWCTKKLMSTAFLLFVMFLAFVVVYNKNPWPLWMSIAMCIVALVYMKYKKQMMAGVFVVVTSLWYTLHLVYDTSYFVSYATGSQDLRALHDLAHDSSLGISGCASNKWCLVRSVLWLMFWIVRIIVCIVAIQRASTAKRLKKNAKINRAVKAAQREENGNASGSETTGDDDDDEEANEDEDDDGGSSSSDEGDSDSDSDASQGARKKKKKKDSDSDSDSSSSSSDDED